MYCSNNLNGKFRAIMGPKLLGPPGDSDYRGTAVLHVNVPAKCCHLVPKARTRNLQETEQQYLPLSCHVWS